MPLWLAPPLVVLPNVLSSVKGADTKVWVKLIVVHFVSWLLTVGGTSALFHAMRGGGKGSAVNEERQTSDAPCADNSSNSGSSAHADSVAEEKALRLRKQMQLLRFWGVVALGCYSASAAKLLPTAPALATTSIAALSAGNVLPPDLKAAVHPIVFTSVVTAAATVLLYRLRGESHTWREALREFFLNGKGGPSAPLTAGDLFFSMLGPCCVGLALRIYTLMEVDDIVIL